MYLWLARPTIRSIFLGASIALIGLFLRAFASGHLTKNELLTTSGPYAYLRNPLYLGSLVLAAGFAMAARNWWIALGMAGIFTAIYLPVIWSEEAFLRDRFPEFSEYARHVPRLFPRLGAFGNAQGSFSWGLYWKHREYNAVVGSLAMILALALKRMWWPR